MPIIYLSTGTYASAAYTDTVVAEAVECGARLEVEGEHLARRARLARARPVAAPPLRHVQPPATARHLRDTRGSSILNITLYTVSNNLQLNTTTLNVSVFKLQP